MSVESRMLSTAQCAISHYQDRDEDRMSVPSFQEQLAALGVEHCWGCGVANEHGLHVKSYWDGDEAICVWQPQPYHIAVPGIVNGGILATLIDCHSAATACADAYRAAGRAIAPGGEPLVYLTARLDVRYLRPTAIGGPLTLRARVVERDDRRTTVECSVTGPSGVESAHGTVICARPRSTPPSQ
jgi:acyl-coenzyme A thioesterase PaaI-like protein